MLPSSSSSLSAGGFLRRAPILRFSRTCNTGSSVSCETAGEASPRKDLDTLEVHKEDSLWGWQEEADRIDWLTDRDGKICGDVTQEVIFGWHLPTLSRGNGITHCYKSEGYCFNFPYKSA